MFVKPVEEDITPLKPKDLNTPPPPTSGSPKTPKSPPRPSEAENMAPTQAAALTIPTVALDSDSIAFDMAACLASSLLGHVLFLKGQIPFPVVQMARMPGANTASRSSKKRVELMTAIDTLSSHLHTTFAALSDAFAHTHNATDKCGPIWPSWLALA
ncbi:hypothetical protein NM688_g4787 [Phlebia brevispora]|uniref:Uncharacterized protein n=1 Tax=Phlebia brevispora TaxID=194682 RepID=A0ACC1T1Z5_9APHY|nr:hypothetical protein NM688_g4787 [Phlebia brevispora]